MLSYESQCPLVSGVSHMSALTSGFSYEGQYYHIPAPDYDDVIKLPNGQFLRPGGMLESLPMQPTDLRVINEKEIGGRRVIEAVAG